MDALAITLPLFPVVSAILGAIIGYVSLRRVANYHDLAATRAVLQGGDVLDAHDSERKERQSSRHSFCRLFRCYISPAEFSQLRLRHRENMAAALDAAQADIKTALAALVLAEAHEEPAIEGQERRPRPRPPLADNYDVDFAKFTVAIANGKLARLLDEATKAEGGSLLMVM